MQVNRLSICYPVFDIDECGQGERLVIIYLAWFLCEIYELENVFSRRVVITNVLR